MIVGASLAGLQAAETLRQEGFTGTLTLVGDEPHEPYDRPPLSKQVRTNPVTRDFILLENGWGWKYRRYGMPALGLNMILCLQVSWDIRRCG